MNKFPFARLQTERLSIYEHVDIKIIRGEIILLQN